MVSQEKLRELKIFAADIRIAAIKSIQSIGVGHVDGLPLRRGDVFALE